MGKTLIRLLVIFSFGSLCTFFPAFAEDIIDKSQYVAVMDFDNETGSTENASLARTLTDRMITYFVNSGSVQVVERSKIRKILDEHALSMSGLIDIEQAVEVGKMLSARYLVIGTLSQVSNNWIINVRVLEVNSGRIIAAEMFETQKQKDLVEYTEKASKIFLTKINAEKNRDKKTILIFNVHSKRGPKQNLSDNQIDRLISVLQKKTNNYGAHLEKISKTDDKNIEMVFYGLSDPLKLAAVLMSDDVLEFRLVQRVFDTPPDPQPEGFEFIRDKKPHSGETVVYKVAQTPELTGLHVKNASLALDRLTNAAFIKVEFDTVGTARLAEITRTNIGKQLIIVLNGNVLMAPVIRDEISDGTTHITGQFDLDKAFQYVVNLKSGHLPASLSLSEIIK